LEPKPPAQDEPHVSRILHLIYPASLVGEPILHRLIRQFDLTFNLRSAQLGIDEGWIEIQATGSSQELERAIRWLTAEGLQVTFPG
jgi:ABC-type methionine transport system ATPase subunit